MFGKAHGVMRFVWRPALTGAAVLSVFVLARPALGSDDLSEPPSPIGVSLCEPIQYPSANAEVIGFRFSLFHARNANVTGLDIGAFISVSDGDVFGMEFSGLVNSVGSSSGALQIAGIANNCYDDFDGVQISGIANMVGGEMGGGQIGCFNSAGDIYGFQIGAFNKADKAAGCQIGVVNVAESMTGIQIGLLNFIKDSSCPCLPIANAKF